jgi:hypothetical protein
MKARSRTGMVKKVSIYILHWYYPRLALHDADACSLTNKDFPRNGYFFLIVTQILVITSRGTIKHATIIPFLVTRMMRLSKKSSSWPWYDFNDAIKDVTT